MQLKINKRSAYAPIRYEATRPFAVPIGKAFIAERNRGEKARVAFLQGQLLALLRTAAARISREQGPGPLQAEILNTQIFGGYVDSGKIIFDLDKTLISTLLLTDAGDIPCGELTFPADSFYLHFGPESGLTDDGFGIEGAFVTRTEGRMVFDLVPQGFGQSYFLSLPMGESMVGAPVKLDDPAKPVSTALRESIAESVEANTRVFEQAAEMERQIEEQYGQIVKVPGPTVRLTEKQPLLQKALGLIVNTLFFLNAEHDDVMTDWGRDTPPDALDALRASTKPGTVRTVENTLLKAGYSKVRFVGRKFAQSSVATDIREAAASGKTLAAHFRRGHFRRQAYGPENALRKTIFVAPVVVNAKVGGEVPGRVYTVSAPTNRA